MNVAISSAEKQEIPSDCGTGEEFGGKRASPRARHDGEKIERLASRKCFATAKRHFRARRPRDKQEMLLRRSVVPDFAGALFPGNNLFAGIELFSRFVHVFYFLFFFFIFFSFYFFCFFFFALLPFT